VFQHSSGTPLKTFSIKNTSKKKKRESYIRNSAVSAFLTQNQVPTKSNGKKGKNFSITLTQRATFLNQFFNQFNSPKTNNTT
jgi:hypothetical protein